MAEAVLSDSDGFQHARVPQLLDDFVGFEALRRLDIVGLDTTNELRGARNHLLQQIHQRKSKIRGYSLLRSTLRSQTATVEAFLVTAIKFVVNRRCLIKKNVKTHFGVDFQDVVGVVNIFGSGVLKGRVQVAGLRDRTLKQKPNPEIMIVANENWSEIDETIKLTCRIDFAALDE